MEDGVIVSWLKKVGDPVTTGEAIAVIETDKAVLDLEAEAEGTLIAIVRQAGERVPVTETIAWIGAGGRAPSARDCRPRMRRGPPAAASRHPGPGIRGRPRPFPTAAGWPPPPRPGASPPRPGSAWDRYPRRPEAPWSRRMSCSYVGRTPRPWRRGWPKPPESIRARLVRDGSGRVRKSDVEAAAAVSSDRSPVACRPVPISRRAPRRTSRRPLHRHPEDHRPAAVPQPCGNSLGDRPSPRRTSPPSSRPGSGSTPPGP
ncbi:MAG: hypothetical protein M0C28_37765 [Candidatus Moduliflexus flocculans]|nr:hypothetical protein [Candidatus Moduliflexus flocculans]